MSPLEDEIRDALRSEAARLREVRPLRLPPAGAHDGARPAARTRRAGWLLTWRGPVVAVAVVLLAAATLVALKSAGGRDPAPASPSGVVGPAGSPRYYVAIGGVRSGGTYRGLGITAGDEQTGRTVGSFLLGKGANGWSGAVSSGGDDRTFVVEVALGQGSSLRPVPGPRMWYLVRIVPGSASPLRVSKLPVKSPPPGGVNAMALSADGSELAVAYDTGKYPAQDFRKDVSRPVTLGVYSVVTGRLRHSWSGTISASFADPLLISDLSWAGDTTVGFAVTYDPQVREEVRTLDLSAAGADLLTASHVVWSQYIPGPRGDIYQEDTPRACGTPALTGNGQAVVCATSTYSAAGKRLAAVWLAYPLATPTRPRVIGTVLQPRDVSSVSPVSVDWANASGTEVIGSWFPTVVTFPGGVKTSNSGAYSGYIGGGAVRQFPRTGDPIVTW